MEHTPIVRRHFLEALGGTGLGLGCSFQVRADDGELLPDLRVDLSEADTIREAIVTFTLDGALDARVRHERHIRLVDVECDFLVAGSGMVGVWAAAASPASSLWCESMGEGA